MNTNLAIKTSINAESSTKDIFYHPNYILRVAGEPVDLLKFPGCGLTVRCIEKKRHIETTLSSALAGAVATLEALIPGVEDKTLSRDLLNSKRALFNGKRVKAGALANLESQLDDEAFSHISSANDLLVKLEQMDAEIQTAYENEVASAYRHLGNSWRRNNMRQGVSYSNPKLFRDFENTYGDGELRPINAKKKRKLDDTLFQYLTRCSTKTSPLSALTVVYVGSWANDNRTSPHIEFKSSTESRVEYKSGLLKQIVDRLLEDFTGWKDYFPLYLNSSIELANSKLRFTQVNKGNTAGGKTWGTGESRVELPLNGALQCILQTLSDHPGIYTDELIARVCEKAPKLNNETTFAYINKLFSIGLVLPDLGATEQVDILDWAEQVLAAFDGRFDTGVLKIRELREYVQSYANQDHATRADVTEKIEALSQELASSIGSSIDPTMERPAFFENTYLTDCASDISESTISAFSDDLHAILELSPILDMNQKIQAQFADYFIWRYGADHICTNPLDLIREFDDIYGVAQFGFEPSWDKMAPDSDTYKNYSEIADSWDAFMAPYLASDVDVDVSAETLRELTAKLPQQIRNRNVSHSYVGQVFNADTNPKFVINQVFGGNSGLMSRFLEILPDDQLEHIKDYLNRCSREGQYAEMPGVFGFNANKHPRMADKEITIEPFANNWQQTEKTSIRDLRLRYDEVTHKVVFIDSDDKILDVWYQGFLIPSLMPQVQRFIAINNANGLNFYTIGTLFNCGLIKEGEITRIPRVSVGNVVISRSMHLVPREFVPDENLTPFDFFMAVQKWKEEHNLPNEAFVRAFPIGDGKVAGADSGIDWNQVSFKDAKPFYVRFDDPRYVRQLARILKRSQFDLTLAEVLPRLDDQHVLVDDRKHVAEFHIELSRQAADRQDP
jgi:Lantibiotic dehydratase, N terminus./Lantibiotic dehydratase, C terminus.